MPARWLGVATATIPLALTSCSVAETEQTEPPLPIELLLEQFEVPGLAMATLNACAIESIEGYGLANIETGTPVTGQTAFEAASLSKPVFALLIVQLADEGVIDLDAPIGERIEAPRVEDRDAYSQITARMVLTHRTGMPNWAGDTDQPDRSDPIPFLAAPGEAYTYSGEAFELLRLYVEDVVGDPLDVIFKRRLGQVMPNSTFAPPLRAGVVASRGYRSAGDTTGRAMSNLGGSAGGLITTAQDYARFVSHVCNGGDLSEQAYAEMITAVSAVPDGQGPGPMSWALGWGVLTLGETEIVLHDGNNGEYRALAGFIPETGEGFVFLANGSNGAELINALVEDG